MGENAKPAFLNWLLAPASFIQKITIQNFIRLIYTKRDKDLEKSDIGDDIFWWFCIAMGFNISFLFFLLLNHIKTLSFDREINLFS